MMRFPLTLSFKIVALAPQIRVVDADGQTVCYVRQKLLKLREAVEVFTDETRGHRLCEIKADRVIDFSATYRFIDNEEREFGSVRRRGLRSLWRANYETQDDLARPSLELHEENGWVKVMDGIFGELPILGMFSGYLFHPSYLISRTGGGEPLYRVRKEPAFWEGRFSVEKLSASADAGDDLRAVMSALMMLLLERRRG